MKKFLVNSKAKIARDISKMIAFYCKKEHGNWIIYSEDENEVMEAVEKLCKFAASEDIYDGKSVFYYIEET